MHLMPPYEGQVSSKAILSIEDESLNGGKERKAKTFASIYLKKRERRKGRIEEFAEIFVLITLLIFPFVLFQLLSHKFLRSFSFLEDFKKNTGASSGILPSASYKLFLIFPQFHRVASTFPSIL